MLRAVFVRTLKPGVTDEEFIRAWLPPGLTPESYQSKVTISHSLSGERQIVSIFEVDCTPEEFPKVLDSLVHPDSATRLAEIVESTQLEAVFEDTAVFGVRQPLGKTSQ